MPIKTENKKNKGGKMKVKITKKNDENYWYNDRIGEVFEVEDTTYPLYYRANGRYKGCYIDKDDCEIINEAEEILKGAEKLSAQLNKSEWAKMPGDEMNTDEEKSYYNGYTEDKPDLNQDLFDYLFKTFNITPLFDELGGLISIFEKHGWDKKGWQKEKPDFPCLFLTRSKYGSETYCNSYTITEQEGYLAIVDGNGEEWGALEDLQADEYFVIERF